MYNQTKNKVKQLVLVLIALPWSSCYTETKNPDYQFMKEVKQQSVLDSTLTTTISITPKKYFFGKVKAANKLSGDFYIKNTGTVAFNIVSIKSNCDCIQTAYSNSKSILPFLSLLITSFTCS